jgi:hypothetical protein
MPDMPYVSRRRIDYREVHCLPLDSDFRIYRLADGSTLKMIP